MRTRIGFVVVLVAAVGVLVLPARTAVHASGPASNDSYSTLTTSNATQSSCVFSVNGFVVGSGMTLSGTHVGFWMRCYLGSSYVNASTIPSGTWGSVVEGYVRNTGTCTTYSGGTAAGIQTSVTFAHFGISNVQTDFYDPALGLIEVSGEVWAGSGVNPNVTCFATGSLCAAGTQTYADYTLSAGCTSGMGSLGLDSYRMVTYATRTSEWPTHRWGDAYEVPPTCQSIGFSYEVREQGVGSDWESVADISDFPDLTFGDSIRLTMDVPDGATLDYLVLHQLGHTPIESTGDSPMYTRRFLGPFTYSYATVLPGMDEPSTTEFAAAIETGVGFHRIVYKDDPVVGPETVSYTFLHLNDTGMSPAFVIQCRLVGATIEVLDSDGTTTGGSILDKDGCESARVRSWPRNDTDSEWGFRLFLVDATTDLTGVEWRYTPVDALDPDPWQSLTVSYLPRNTAFEYDFTLDKATNPDPSLVQFQFSCAKAGGGTKTTTQTSTAPPGADSSGGPEGDESCYSDALGSMELTRPKSWVTGAGRMGVCLVEWLFVPDSAALSESFGDFKEELSEQLPFSIVYSVIEFGANFYDAAQDSTDSGCMDMGGSWSFGSYGSVSVPDVCIGDDVSVSPGQRQTLVWLMLGGLWFAVVRHAFALVRGTPAYGGHQG